MFKQYTKCYVHTPGDKPFNKADLAKFVGGAAAPGLIVMILAFASGASVIGYVALAITYAATITAVANEWLFHRLVCLDGAKCAMGIVETDPKVAGFGEFDNDDFFDLRLMPHRPGDEYQAPGATGFAAGTAGPSSDGKTEKTPENDIYNDGFQGQALLRPTIADLPYDLTRSVLHCEAEGNFWQAMKDYAPVMGVATAAGAAAGCAVGAAIGCAIGGLFGPIGAAIGCAIGCIAGAVAGAAAASYAGAQIAFHSDPGDVQDANVGDQALGPIAAGDEVVVFGQHVYDGFHEGWHEFHPLMAIMKINSKDTSQYLEWDPDFLNATPLPSDVGIPAPLQNLTVADMQAGLKEPKFRGRAEFLRDRWCKAVGDAFTAAVRNAQARAEHRWTIHPAVDGCIPSAPPPAPR
jgi:hypothetical protein